MTASGNVGQARTTPTLHSKFPSSMDLCRDKSGCPETVPGNFWGVPENCPDSGPGRCPTKVPKTCSVMFCLFSAVRATCFALANCRVPFRDNCPDRYPKHIPEITGHTRRRAYTQIGGPAWHTSQIGGHTFFEMCTQ